MAFDPNDENDKKLLQEAIDKALEEQVSGLKNKNSELIGKEKKLKAEIDELKKKFDGLDPEVIRDLISKAQNDEEGKLIAEGKIQEVVDRRTERMQADYKKQLEAKEKTLQELQEFSKKFKNQVLDSALRDAALKAGVLPEAAEDAVLRGRLIYTVDGLGHPVAMKDGEPIMGKDGKSPMPLTEWAEDLRETAPHLWPQAKGGNASGPGGKVTKKFSEYTEKERIELYRADPAKFRQMMEADKASAT